VVQDGGREVDGGDVPTVPGQPQRLGAVAAAGVEGSPGLESGRDGGQGRVGWAVRELVGVLSEDLGPLLVPAGGLAGGGQRFVSYENDWPQPQVRWALGLSIEKPAWLRPSL
jgi:hypothetical protein